MGEADGIINGTGIIKISKPAVKNSKGFIGTVANNSYNNSLFEAEQFEQMKLKSNYKYIKADIMTSAEKQLYLILRKGLPRNVSISLKTRLADIVKIDERVDWEKADFYKIASKHIDYTIIDNDDGNLICAVELGDYTHDRYEVMQRDRFIDNLLYDCDIPFVNIKTRILAVGDVDIKPIQDIVRRYNKEKRDRMKIERKYK